MSSSRSSMSSRTSSSAAAAAPPSRISDIAPPTRMLQDARFKLFLRVHSGQNLQSSTQGTYCKLYLGDTIMVSGSQSALMQFNLLNDNASAKVNGANAVDDAHPTHRVFRTHIEYPKQPAHPVWNEKFEVGVFDPTKEVVSIRVKSQQMIYCPTIGACAIYLKQLKLGETVDQWFPLHKGQRGAGHIRLQLHLSMNANVRVIQQPKAVPVATKAVSTATPARANANAIALQKKREEEMLRQKRLAEKEAAVQREEEERRRRRKAEKEKEKEKARLRAEEEEEERRRQRRKAEKKEKARLRAEEEEKEKERSRREQAERERMLRAVRTAEEAAAAEEEERRSVKSQSSGKQIYVCSSDEEDPRGSKKSAQAYNQAEEGMHQTLEDAAAKVVEAMANAFDSDGGKTIEYVSENNLVSQPSSEESSKRRSSQSAKTKKKPSSRTSSRSSKQSFSATVQSIEDAIQLVEQNALPSDSSDDDSSSSSSMSSEEERRLLRKLKEKKKRRKEKKAKRKTKKKKSKSKMVDSDSDSDSSSSSSSSSSTSSDEKRKRKDKKKKSSKKSSRKSQSSRKSSLKSSKSSKNKDNNDNGNQWGEYISAAGDIASLYNTLTGSGGNDQDSSGIEAISQLDIQQDGGFDVSSMGDWLQAASSVSDLMSVSDDPTDSTAAVLGVVTAGIVPLGMYLGKKIRQASANSQQRQQQQDQQFVCQINGQQTEQLQMAVEVLGYDDTTGADDNNYEYVGEQQTESTYYF